MKRRGILSRAVIWLMVVFLVTPPWALGQQSGGAPSFKQEELDQLLAPIALYPDSVVSQILMASTYPCIVREAKILVRLEVNHSLPFSAVCL